MPSKAKRRSTVVPSPPPAVVIEAALAARETPTRGLPLYRPRRLQDHQDDYETTTAATTPMPSGAVAAAGVAAPVAVTRAAGPAADEAVWPGSEAIPGSAPLTPRPAPGNNNVSWLDVPLVEVAAKAATRASATAKETAAAAAKAVTAKAAAGGDGLVARVRGWAASPDFLAKLVIGAGGAYLAWTAVLSVLWTLAVLAVVVAGLVHSAYGGDWAKAGAAFKDPVGAVTGGLKGAAANLWKAFAK